MCSAHLPQEQLRPRADNQLSREKDCIGAGGEAAFLNATAKQSSTYLKLIVSKALHS